MEGFGIEKLSLVLVIVLVLFGARRIPEIGASIGKGIREFKRGMNGAAGDAEREHLDAQPNEAAPTSASELAEPASEPKRLIEGSSSR